MNPQPGFKLVERPKDATLFRRQGQSIDTEALLADARVMAGMLPASRYLLNLCRDRYAFTVGFIAAVRSDRICLLIGDRSPAGLAALAAEFPDCVAVIDDDGQEVPPGMPSRRAAPEGVAATALGDNITVPGDQVVAIVFTSGSTGHPVGHPKHWGSLVRRSIAAGQQFALTERAPPTIIGTVPPHHMYGFETTVLLPLHAPAASWCGPAFFPDDVQLACASVPPSPFVVTTPLQIRALLAVDADLPGLDAIISATAPLDAALAAAAERRWKTRVLEIFGATEVGSIASRRTLDDEAWSLYPGVTLHAEGEKVTALLPLTAPHPLDDEVELLGDRRFRLIGRRTDIVKLGGRRASIAGLNRILLEIDGVEDGTFVLPEGETGATTERLMAVVVAPGRGADSIIGELRRRLDPLFVPRRIVCVDSMHRNDVGKLSHERVLQMLRAASGDTA